MRYVYFTKTLQSLDLPGLIAFLKDAGLNGADLTVRPEYPVNPDNALTELPRAAKQFQDAGLIIGLVTAPTNLSDANSRAAQALFDAAGKAGVPAIKIGYFPYRAKFDASLTEARGHLAGFAKLAERTRVRACYHTHSGNYLGNNAASLRLLLQDLDPHHVGAFVDTGHLAVNGGPIRMELDSIRPWLSLVAIKDMAWEKAPGSWKSHVVPAGEGIVRWSEVAQGLKECNYNGTVSLHAEYETRDLSERKELAKRELAFLRGRLA
jgi:sugar phosphate isomerase/epimerase